MVCKADFTNDILLCDKPQLCTPPPLFLFTKRSLDKKEFKLLFEYKETIKFITTNLDSPIDSDCCWLFLLMNFYNLTFYHLSTDCTTKIHFIFSPFLHPVTSDDETVFQAVPHLCCLCLFGQAVSLHPHSMLLLPIWSILFFFLTHSIPKI